MLSLPVREQHLGGGVTVSPAPEVKQALREWVALKSGKVRSEDLDDETPILEQRIITSLQVMDLILHIEN